MTTAQLGIVIAIALLESASFGATVMKSESDVFDVLRSLATIIGCCFILGFAK